MVAPSGYAVGSSTTLALLSRAVSEGTPHAARVSRASPSPASSSTGPDLLCSEAIPSGATRPTTSRVRRLISPLPPGPSRSLASTGTTLKSTDPAPRIAVTVAVTRSTVATALASCSVT